MAAQSKDRVLTLIQKRRRRVRAFGVKRLGLFGSFVRDEQGGDSDVDLLVEFEPGCKTFDNFIHLALFLEDLFNRRVELITPEALSPYLGPRILQEAEVVTLEP